MHTGKVCRVWFAMGLCILIAACGPTVRRSGQVEMFVVQREGNEQRIRTPKRMANSETLEFHQIRVGPESRVDPMIGDLVRFTTDSVTITVPTVYLDHLPATLSGMAIGRYDAMLFAEVWENAAMERSAPSLNRIVHVALDQPVPGRLNFTDAIAYGPTTFKGHPIRIKFTLVLLQRRAKESGDTAAKSLQDFISLAGAGTPAGTSASTMIGLVRQIMRSLPDVEAFDFETTFLPFSPTHTHELAANTLHTTLSRAGRLAYSRKDLAHIPIAIDRLIHAFHAERRTILEEVVLKAKTQTTAVGVRDSLLEYANTLTQVISPDELNKITQPLAALTVTPEPNAALIEKSIQEFQKAVSAALDPSRLAEFVRVTQGAERIKGTTNAASPDVPEDASIDARMQAEIKAAIAQIQSCSDYSKISDRPLESTATHPLCTGGIEHELLLEQAHARPWLRYGLYTIAETRNYRTDRSADVIFDYSEAQYLNDRIQGVMPIPPTRGRQPNWILMDILPGQIPLDDRVLRAASDAANRSIESVGYTPSQRLIDDPTRIARHFEEIVNDTTETLIQVRAERLALEMARKVQAKCFVPPQGVTTPASAAELFVPSSRNGNVDQHGPFMNQFINEIRTILDGEGLTDEVKQTRMARWMVVGERVRVLFERRFSN